MDGQRFDDLARLFSASLNRKGFIAIVAGIAAPAALSDDGAAKKRKKRNRGNGGGGDVEPQGGNGGACSGSCSKTADCPDSPDCICDLETNQCETVLCGGVCVKDGDCGDLPGCSCQDVGDGDTLHCVTATCGGFCNKGLCSELEGDGCVCDDTDQCVTVTVTCAGTCFKDADCPDLPGCVCTINIAPSRVGGEGIVPGSCVTEACPGACNSNPDCEEQGADECVCFLGVDTANAELVAEVIAEGNGGECGECLGRGESCDASSECCGQLVCLNGTCQRKPKPKPKKDRCHSHGGSCQRDSDCCAQGTCYKGKCGEKDTHCHHDSECAQGYRCQGGPVSHGHKRCRKNGRRKRNKINRKNG